MDIRKGGWKSRDWETVMIVQNRDGLIQNQNESLCNIGFFMDKNWIHDPPRNGWYLPFLELAIDNQSDKSRRKITAF